MLSVLILYVNGEIYKLMSIPDHRILRNFFIAGLFNFRVFARNLLRNILYLYSILIPDLEYEPEIYV